MIFFFISSLSFLSSLKFQTNISMILITKYSLWLQHTNKLTEYKETSTDILLLIQLM